MKNIVFSVVMLLAAMVANAQGIGSGVNTVKWTGKKVTGEHYGYIQIKSLELQHKGGVPTEGTIVVDMNSMTCTDLTDTEYNGKLIGHLKSDDFFSVAKFPESKLEIKSVKKLSDTEVQVTSHLTVKGQTHPNSFVVKVENKGAFYVYTGKVMVDRTLYDIRYGSGKFFENLGDRMINDNFELDFVLQVK